MIEDRQNHWILVCWESEEEIEYIQVTPEPSSFSHIGEEEQIISMDPTHRILKFWLPGCKIEPTPPYEYRYAEGELDTIFSIVRKVAEETKKVIARERDGVIEVEAKVLRSGEELEDDELIVRDAIGEIRANLARFSIPEESIDKFIALLGHPMLRMNIQSIFDLSPEGLHLSPESYSLPDEEGMKRATVSVKASATPSPNNPLDTAWELDLKRD